MGQLNNVFRMMFILRRGKKVKIKELAEELEVNERQIRRYKGTLDEFFDIESIPGPDGGYIFKEQYFPFKELLTEHETNSLKIAIGSLEENFIEKGSDLEKAISKINFSILNKEEELLLNEHIIPYSYPKNIDGNISTMHDDIYECIFQGYELYIKYCDNNGVVSERTVQPHKYLRYKGEYYLVATCLIKNQIRYFKLTRIKEYRVTNVKFSKAKNIDEILEHERKNSLGIFGGKEYNLELLIRNPMANTIKERVWVDNQEIIEHQGGDITFKAKMKGGPEVTSWILSMGDTVTVIAPEELKEEVKEKLKKMIENI